MTISSRRQPTSAPVARPGSVIVEFAVLVPVLVFLMLGMLEMARAIQVRQVLGDAARAACRQAIQYGYTSDNVSTNAKAILDDYLDVNSADTTNPSANATVTVAVNGSSATNASAAKKGDVITVTVSIPASSIGWVTPRYITSGTSIIQSVTMIRQM